MTSIPKIQTQDRVINQLQDNIIQGVAPLLKNPLTQGVIVQQSLSSGSNTIKHGLGRTMQGWIVVDVSAATTIYRTQMDDKTLTLNSSAAASVSLYVF